MKRRTVLRRTAAVVLGLLVAVAGALAAHASAASSSRAVATKSVAGTVDTRLVINRFTATRKRIVGHGTATSILRNASGAVTSTKKQAFNVTVQTATGPGPCQILYLELDELDLTLLGLRVFLRSATEGEPVKLTLSADSTHGILGKLFCDLAKTSVTQRKLSAAAKTLTKKVHKTTLLRAKATLYAPSQRQTYGVRSTAATQAVANCEVLHLILGPLHLDVLGLIVDLNKVALDLEAIPGTTLGDLFCDLAGIGGSTWTSTSTTSTATTTTTSP
jgi:hypothetical protein